MCQPANDVTLTLALGATIENGYLLATILEVGRDFSRHGIVLVFSWVSLGVMEHDLLGLDALARILQFSHTDQYEGRGPSWLRASWS